MKYKPQKRDPHALLSLVGFTSAKNRGYELVRRTKIKKKSPIRIHAFVTLEGEIEVHEDYEVGGLHKSQKNSGRLTSVKQALESVDLGEVKEFPRLTLVWGLKTLVELDKSTIPSSSE